MRFRICPPGVILDIFKASQLDIGRFGCLVATDSALAICNAARLFAMTLPSRMQKSAQICYRWGTQWSGFVQNAQIGIEKKPSFVWLPGAVADIWCTSQKRCQAQSIFKKTYLIALAYEGFRAFDWVTNQQISTWSDQVIQSDLFSPWRSLSLAKGSLNNPKMVIKNCQGHDPTNFFHILTAHLVPRPLEPTTCWNECLTLSKAQSTSRAGWALLRFC